MRLYEYQKLLSFYGFHLVEEQNENQSFLL